MIKIKRTRAQSRATGRRSFLGRFSRNRSGTGALEFAIVSVPFLALLLATFETAIIFFANFTMENGVNETARRIRTGEVQQAGMTEADFRQELCDQIGMLLQCTDSLLKIDVRKFESFQNVNFPDPLDGGGAFANNFQFDPGEEGDVVLVRVFYSWPVMTPMHGMSMSNMSGNKRLLTAAAAFRNEPFGELQQ